MHYVAGVEGFAIGEPSIAIAVLLILGAAVVNLTLAWVFLAAFMRAPDRTRTHLTRLTSGSTGSRTTGTSSSGVS